MMIDIKKIASKFLMWLIFLGYGHDEQAWGHRNDILPGYHPGYANPYAGYFQAYRQRR